jgi:hypothetical protein
MYCRWHRIARLPIDEQIAEALHRRPLGIAKWGEHATRPSRSWPAGRRWCSGCNFYVPLWYCQGSRCKACASHASYAAHIQKAYGITYEFYLAIYEAQGGRCYICRKKPATKRLAVDHNHETLEVRGLLCPGSEYGCNTLLGYIRDNVDTARRIATYLEDPPARAVREGRDLPAEVVTASGGVMAGRSRVLAKAELPHDNGGTADIMRKQAEQAIEARARKAREREYADGDPWRWPDGHDGPWDIFHAVPDALAPKVWARRLELAREREAKIAIQRG